MSSIASLNIDIVGSVAGLEAAMNEAATMAENAGKKMQSAGKAVSVGISAPLTAVAGLAVNASTALNENLGNVQSLGVAQEQVEQYKLAIQDMSISVAKDTSDLGDGLYQVVSAFGDSADTIKILEINAKAAKAGLATTTDAINLTSAVTKGYGDTSAEAVGKVSDLAFKTVQLGQTTFPELASSMGRVVPLGASMGASMEELFGVMATATGVTGSAAEVSTQLRGVLQSLAAPTGNMSALIEEWGYSSGDAALEALGLQGVIEKVVKAAETSGEPLQKYISSIEGQTLALALAGPQADVFTEKLAAMEDSAGAMDEAFKAQTEGINASGFAMEQARQKFNVMLQKLGDGLAPMLSKLIDLLMPVVDYILAWADAFSRAAPEVQMMVAGVGAFLIALGPALVVLGTFVSSLSSLAPVLGAIGTAIGFVLSPLGLLVVGFGALFAFDVGGLRTKLTNLATTIRETFGAFSNYISAVLEDGDYLNDWLTHLPEGLQPFALAIGRFIGEFDKVKEAASDFKDAIKWVWEGEGDNVDWWHDITSNIGDALGISEETTDAWAESLYTTFSDLSTKIDGVRATWEMATGLFSQGFGLPEAELQNIADRMDEAFGKDFTDKVIRASMGFYYLKGSLQAVAASDEWSMLKEQAGEAVASIAESFTGMFSGEVSFAEFRETASEELAKVGTALQNVLDSDAFASVKGSIRSIFNAVGLLEPLENLGADAQAVFVELETYLGPPLERLREAMSGIFEIDFTAITDGVQAIKDAFSSIFQDEDAEGAGAKLVAGLGVAAVQVAIESLVLIIENSMTLLQGLIETVGNTLTLFGTLAEGVRDIIDGALNQDVTQVVQGVQTVIEGLITFLTNQLTTIATIGTQIKDSVLDFAGATLNDIGILIGEPEWLQNMLDWQPEVPEWVTDMIDWVPEVPDWVSDLFDFKLPRPEWLDTLIGLFNRARNRQLGTRYDSGGWSWVGEAGPELMYVPRGAAILPNRPSAAIAGSGGGITINVNSMNVRDEEDISKIARELAALTRRRGDRL